jgi:hypothetical protein
MASLWPSADYFRTSPVVRTRQTRHRILHCGNAAFVQLDALKNRVLFSLVTHGVPEDRRRQCGYSFAHLV